MKEEIIKKYLNNGIGFNCNTNELKDLRTLMNQNVDLRLKNLEMSEKRKEELYDIEIDDSALGIIQRDARDNELDKINKYINLIIISLRFENINDFIEGALK